MILYNDFLPDNVLAETLSYVDKEGFKDYDFGEKNFIACLPTPTLQAYKEDKLSTLTGQKLTTIFSFIRRANDKEDTDWRIHADQIIFGEQPKFAAVLYLSDIPNGVDNGTAFWTHEEYGSHLNVGPEEYDKVLLEDSNKKEKFQLDQIVGYKQNRVVVYEANRFHSKWPNQAWPEGRIVMASFYK